MTVLRLASKKIAAGLAPLTRNKTSSISRGFASVPEWATYDPEQLGATADIYDVKNCVNGVWTKDTKSNIVIPHPMDRDAHPIFTVPDTQEDELGPFIESLRQCPKTGLHNPLKNPERYVQYGEITRRVRSRYVLDSMRSNK